MGRRQMVRHGPLEPAFGGSNPPAPVTPANSREILLRRTPEGREALLSSPFSSSSTHGSPFGAWWGEGDGRGIPLGVRGVPPPGWVHDRHGVPTRVRPRAAASHAPREVGAPVPPLLLEGSRRPSGKKRRGWLGPSVPDSLRAKRGGIRHRRGSRRPSEEEAEELAPTGPTHRTAETNPL